MRYLASLVVLFALAAVVTAQDTPAAARTKKLLKTKTSVEFKDTRLEDAVKEISEEVKGIRFLLDAKGGVSRNRTVTYTGKDKTVEVILDEMLTKMGGLGYIVISKKGDAYDGTVKIKVGKERGEEKKAD